LTWLAAALFLTGLACAAALALGPFFGVGAPRGPLLFMSTVTLVGGLGLYHLRADAAGMRDRSATILAAVSWVALIAGFFIQYPDATQHRFDRHRQTCLERQYRISVAVLLYCQDHQRFPATLDQARATGITDDILVCPEGGGYGYNANLPGRRYLEVAARDGVLLTADSQSTRPLLTDPDQLARDRHRQDRRRGFCASYADGHVAFVAQDAEISLEAPTRVMPREERGIIVVPEGERREFE
ncbi:MAG TPA: hypothetical protein PLZ36_04255, partial [Armatimonadota bacterium]|nr:hypothetical protein [Armatimonadota bacterium]